MLLLEFDLSPLLTQFMGLEVDLKEAKADLKFKRVSRDLDQFKGKTKFTLEDAILAYRSITGACALGIKDFLANQKVKKSYTVKEIIELTRGHYGHEASATFFEKEKHESYSRRLRSRSHQGR